MIDAVDELRGEVRAGFAQLHTRLDAADAERAEILGHTRAEAAEMQVRAQADRDHRIAAAAVERYAARHGTPIEDGDIEAPLSSGSLPARQERAETLRKGAIGAGLTLITWLLWALARSWGFDLPPPP